MLRAQDGEIFVAVRGLREHMPADWACVLRVADDPFQQAAGVKFMATLGHRVVSFRVQAVGVTDGTVVFHVFF